MRPDGPRAIVPDHHIELELAAEHGGSAVVVGMDEVGRGALAGPVVIGACAIRIDAGRVTTPLPAGVRDSKLLTARRREALVGPIAEAALSHSLGWASPAEIDEHGIMAALARAALRALEGLGPGVDAILLDGNVDVLTAHLGRRDEHHVPTVALRVGADRRSASVAAASVLAKVARDRHMVELAASAPDYGWASNKGYGAAAHRAAIERLGPHAEHRRSWRLTWRGGTPTGGTAARGADVLWGDRSDGPQEATR